jgi:hypothetical protein
VASGAIGRAVSATAGVSPCPHPPQNSSAGSLANPHDGHARASAAPHFAQKRRPARLSAPQPLHRTGGLIAGDRHEFHYLAERRLAYGGVLPHVSSERASRIMLP